MIRKSFEEHKRELSARRDALGDNAFLKVTENSGVARTAEKRALLKALDALAREKGEKPKFSGNY